ncbi:sensor domain-containing protein [Bacillus sp. SG-1]|uniref:sensor domain-containing protein n=1 Tax=Bacillus sp. SG-1 TaxID=161544 RepID=UPI0001543CA3|nr:EAL domain-containing protein [Bacillus sp. SG-1]EDL66589.1 sensory box protein/GGDEF domain protein [Bacillus sp. SG-1]
MLTDNKEQNSRQFFSQLGTLLEKDHPQSDFARSMFESLIEKAPIGVYILEEGSVSYINNYYSDLLGYTREEFTQGLVSLQQIIHPEDYPTVQARIEGRNQGNKKVERYRVRNINKQGKLIYTEIQSYMEIICDKRVLFGSVIDITEQIEAQQMLEESNEKYKSLFESSPDAMYSMDENGILIDVNPAGEQLIGYSTKEMKGMPFMPLVASEDLPEAIKHFESAKVGEPSSAELVLIRKDSQKIHVEATHYPMKVNGEIVGTYGTARDITKKKLYDEKMRELAFYDPLTRLPNRKLFEDRLGQIIKLAKIEEKLFSVIFLDLDRFKFINDSMGHHIGDEFLKLVADRLKQSIRSTDTLSRLAGDEFTILLPDITEEDVISIAERINQSLAEPFQVSGHWLSVSASIGIAFSTGKNVGVSEIIHRADTAMYQTKKFRRSQYTIYSDEMEVDTSYNLIIERDLPLAVINNELELYYQPIMNLESEKVIAMEALIRWHHPELGMVAPNDFIRVAEECGQIIPIGNWVLETACIQNKKWQDSGKPPFKVAVNVSTKQLQQYDFVDSVKKVLAKSGLEAKWLELEVTESILLDDVEEIKESLTRLRGIGVSISIDDFGTGYTSLSYLRQYPFDTVKIDKSFIDDISRDLHGKRITSAIISLAHSLNMNVVAEGIEGETELIFLKREKCDAGQGYYFSKPIPVHLLPDDLLIR